MSLLLLYLHLHYVEGWSQKSFQVRYIGVSNETSYGVMEFVHAAKNQGLPKIVSIQNSYSLLLRCRYESKFSSAYHTP